METFSNGGISDDIPIDRGYRRTGKPAVSVACIHCKKAHLACDESRPCKRCVKLGKQDTCVDHVPKKRGRPAYSSANGLNVRPRSRSQPSIVNGSQASEQETGSSFGHGISSSKSDISQSEYGQNQRFKTEQEHLGPLFRAVDRVLSSEATSSLKPGPINQVSLSPYSSSIITDGRSSISSYVTKDNRVHVARYPPRFSEFSFRDFIRNRTGPKLQITCSMNELNVLSSVRVDETTTNMLPLSFEVGDCVYNYVHPVDRKKLLEFHQRYRNNPSQPISSIVAGRASDPFVNIHFAGYNGKFNLYTLFMMSNDTQSQIFQLTIYKYEHPALHSSPFDLGKVSGNNS